MKYVFAVFVSYLVLKQGVSSRESKIPLSQKQSPISIDIYRVVSMYIILLHLILKEELSRKPKCHEDKKLKFHVQ